MARANLFVAGTAIAVALAGTAWTQERDRDRERGGLPANTRSIEARAPEKGAPASRWIKFAQIDPDAMVIVQRHLAIRGFYDLPADGNARPEVWEGLRRFARARSLESRDGEVSASVLDELGAWPEVAVGMAEGEGARAPGFTPAEMWRMNYALWSRRYMEEKPVDRITGSTLTALRQFQKDTGYGAQRSEVIRRVWLYRLGVATEESCPPRDGT